MTRLVYSTGGGDPRRCDRCGVDPCRCDTPSLAPSEHDLRVRREKAGRGGKTVTTVGPLYLDADAAKKLLRTLKQACGSGGTLKRSDDTSRVIEIQGDHVARILERLGGAGFPAKRAGG